MKLSSKILTIVVVTVGGAALIAYLVASRILLSGFSRMQEDQTRLATARTLAALSRDINRLSIVTGDWGRWDETYQFITDRNRQYIDNNLVGTNFTNIRVDHVVYLDLNGKMAYAAGYDLSSRQPIPASDGSFRVISSIVRSVIADGSPLRGSSGLAVVSGEPYMVAAYPILKSKGTGPSRGTIVMTCQLSRAKVKRLAQVLGLDVGIFALHNPAVPQDVREICGQLSGGQTVVRIESAERSVGYTLLDDIRGEPAAIIRVNTPASVLAQGNRSVRWLMISMLSVGALFAVVSFTIVRRIILDRLARISDSLKTIGRTGDFSTRLSAVGSDELSNVASTVNWMLESLGKAHDELEARVEERTRELAQARESLQTAYDREHRIAEVLQQSLVQDIDIAQPEYDIVARYQPSLEEANVGGDFYDVFSVSDNRVAVVIGDVAGKGLTAAVYTAMVKYMLRGYAHESPQPAQVLSRLNDTVCDYTPEDTFITVFLGVLDPKNRQFVYASAGHDSPLLLTLTECRVSQLAATGTVIGSSKGMDYATSVVTLAPGDAIMLYTDGITDARNGGPPLGIDRLIEVFRASAGSDAGAVLRAAFDAASEAARGNWPDDAAVMVVKANPQWGPAADTRQPHES